MIPRHPNTRRVHRDSGIFSVTIVTIRGGETKRIHMNMTCLFWFSKLLSHDKVEIKSIFNWSLFLSFVTDARPGQQSAQAVTAVRPGPQPRS